MKISLGSDIDALSNVKNRIPEVFEETSVTHRPKIITQNGKAIGVMSDIASYEAIVRKINLMKMVLEGEESIHDEKPISLAELKRRNKKLYGK
jgi:PHD/YefM family antitoxin component YafN of YafNO toxin-antitoxin module